MGRRTRGTAALGAVFLALTGLSACGGVSGNSVASVGGTSITTDTFNHWLKIAASSSQQQAGQRTSVAVPQPPDFQACIAQLRKSIPAPAKGAAPPTDTALKAQCQQQYSGFRDTVLQFLITADWVQGEAKDQGVNVSDPDVQKQFNTIKARQFPMPAAFQTFLTQSGQTVPDLLLRVKLNLLSSKIRDKIVKGRDQVSQAQIAAYYASHQTSFGQPERRDLRLILVKTPGAAAQAKGQIQHGKSIATVAKSLSIDQATKAKGGALTGVARGQQEKALDDAVFAAKRGVLTGPVKTQFGYYVFQVQKVTPGSQQTLAQATPMIKQQLTSQMQQAALAAFSKTFQAKWKAKTDCRSSYVMADCKQYKAPQTPALPGGGAVPPPQGGGAPPQGGGAPPQGGGAPPQGGGAPPQGGGAPPQGGGAPPQGGTTPSGK